MPALSRRQLLGGAAVVAGAGALGTARAAGASPRVARTADTVVVGAGLAGLTAARRLTAAGQRVIVLEARDRVGGRTLSHDLGGGKAADLGGTWIGPTQHRVAALAGELGLATFAEYDTGNAVYYGNGIRSTFSDTGPTGGIPLDPLILPDALVLTALIDQMATQVPVDAPWTAAKAQEWDSQTLDEFVRQHSLLPQIRKVISAALEAIFGAEAREMSLLYALYYVAAAGDPNTPGTFERLINIRGGAQATRFVDGAQSLSLRMAAALGDRVHLGSPVRRIEQSTSGVAVTSDRLTVTARRVVVAVPPALAGRIDYSPALPAAREAYTQHSPQGALLKCEAIYDQPFWRAAGLSGNVVSDTGPAKICYDVTPAAGTPGGMLGFVGGDEARRFEGDHAALRQAVLKQFVIFFGPAAARPRDFLIADWDAEVWSRGCPVHVLPPGVLTGYRSALADPVGRFHWAGTETAGYWHGYMDGAVSSGGAGGPDIPLVLQVG